MAESSRRAVGDRWEHDTQTPDAETASAAYAARFEGAAGRWMLDVQSNMVSDLLAGTAERGPLSVLEVGGGHGQLTDGFAAAGHRVTVHGSALVCHRRGRLGERIVSTLESLPFTDRSFDLVVAVRLLPHVVGWRELLVEMARVSRRFVLVDFPVRGAAHRLAPFLFRWKRKLEGNTRPYFDYVPAEVSNALRESGYRRVTLRRQFFWPMVLHRKMNRPTVSRSLEGIARSIGLTRRAGSPCLMLGSRIVDDVGSGGNNR